MTSALLCMLGTSCAEYSQTTRLVNGREVTGRSVTAEAYARYLEGSRLETLGRDAEALAEYRRALEEDAQSVEIQTRIAHLVCKGGYIEGTEEFDAAIELDSGYEPAWRLRARCALLHNDRGPALTWAREALRVAPLQYSATAMLSDVLIKQEQYAEAERLLMGYVSRYPTNQRAWKKLAELGALNGNSQWAYAGPEQSSPLSARRSELSGDVSRSVKRGLKVSSLQSAERSSSSSQEEDADFQRLDRTVLHDDLEGARQLATRLRISPIRLGFRAFELGRAKLALEQGKVVLAADPDNTDARILTLLAAERLNLPGEFRRALSRQSPTLRPPNPEAAGLFFALLERKFDRETASLWLAAFEQSQDPAGVSPEQDQAPPAPAQEQEPPKPLPRPTD